MKGRRLAALLLAAFTAGACAHSSSPGVSSAPRSTAAPPDGGAVARSIVLCKTTEADLIARLGEPTRSGVLHRSRIVSWITQWDHPSRYLGVLLDDRGVVVDLYWDLPTEIPWSPSDQCHGRE